MNLDYSAGHPWYYVLGGPVLSPKQIAANAKKRGYKGYLHEAISKASQKQLRQLRMDQYYRFRQDLSKYRRYAFDLHRFRLQHPDPKNPECLAVHTHMFLAHNHLYNSLSHLRYIDQRLSYQMDLFI